MQVSSQPLAGASIPKQQAKGLPRCGSCTHHAALADKLTTWGFTLANTCLQGRDGQVVLRPNRHLQPDEAALVQLPYRHAIQVGIAAVRAWCTRCLRQDPRRQGTAPLTSGAQGANQANALPRLKLLHIAAGAQPGKPVHPVCCCPLPRPRTARRRGAPLCGTRSPLWGPAGGTPPPAG